MFTRRSSRESISGSLRCSASRKLTAFLCIRRSLRSFESFAGTRSQIAELVRRFQTFQLADFLQQLLGCARFERSGREPAEFCIELRVAQRILGIAVCVIDARRLDRAVDARDFHD